jgi:membrane-anchored protein YejM (alkaline phosphatase superfamily)
MKRTAATESKPHGAAVECVALCLASLLLALVFWLAMERPHYRPLLAIAIPEERLALLWTVIAQTLWFFAPGVLAATFATWCDKPRLARRLFLASASAVLVFLALDLELYVAIGRHLADLARFALVPGANQVAGNRSPWLSSVVTWLALGTAGTWLSSSIARRSVIELRSRLSLSLAWALSAVFLLLVAVCSVLPIFFAPFYPHPALREGLSAQLVWSPRIGTTLGVSSASDPRWAALETGLTQTYRRVFPLVFAQHRTTVVTRTPGQRLNVLLIVVESFRADAFTKERMPRVFTWAQRGLIASQHFGGSTYSEAGAFSLLYGRSPLLFEFSLDAHQQPTWCEIAHRFEMDCDYYSGHPKIWMRREEFLNPRVVDHFVHDDSGDWNQWDRNALEHAVTAIHKSGERPAISTVLLMSTHFEYQYPHAYERHLPVLVGAKWKETNLLGLDASSRVPLTNRYLNSLAFTDDVVADAIEQLDPTRTVIVFTGDHGESLGDDGRFSHGYGFPDVITHVPFAMVGPGIPAGVRETPSLHVDVLRTLIHLLGGTADGPAESQDLLAPARPRESLLFAHCEYTHDSADALLVRGKRRIRMSLGLREPKVQLKGGEDELGHPASLDDLSAAELGELVSAFERELRVLWRPAPP